MPQKLIQILIHIFPSIELTNTHTPHFDNKHLSSVISTTFPVTSSLHITIRGLLWKLFWCRLFLWCYWRHICLKGDIMTSIAKKKKVMMILPDYLLTCVCVCVLLYVDATFTVIVWGWRKFSMYHLFIYFFRSRYFFEENRKHPSIYVL